MKNSITIVQLSIAALHELRTFIGATSTTKLLAVSIPIFALALVILAVAVLVAIT